VFMAGFDSATECSSDTFFTYYGIQ